MAEGVLRRSLEDAICRFLPFRPVFDWKRGARLAVVGAFADSNCLLSS
jgi:hypothetical protein